MNSLLKSFIIFELYCIVIGFIVNRETQSQIPDKDEMKRSKRESDCRPGSYNFRCDDGTCLRGDTKCDGVADCPDGSDETFHLCRNIRCPYYHFRCAYGACVDGEAPCNGVKDCVDNSDELQPMCQKNNNIVGDKFKCINGDLIEVYERCDGIAECEDGSDESLSTCASTVCPSHLFQCAYGACVDAGADCNNLRDCADGSDESDLLCNRTTTPNPTTTTTEAFPSSCVLPRHPRYGLYHLIHGAKYIPGSVVRDALVGINVTCFPGFKPVGVETIYCYLGHWSSDFPQCARTCKLERSPSVAYRCITDDESTRECDDYEVEGIMIQPECVKPNYFSPTELLYMVCMNGQWNYQPRCDPECGTMTPRAQPLVAGGRPAEAGEVPWHAGVYTKLTDPPQQICGASVLSETVLVSAAHCFWFTKRTEPAENYAVAAGKLYRQWDHPEDLDYQQTSDLQAIHIDRYYRGATLNYQHDLAILIVAQPFSYRPYLRPLCVHFPSNNYETRLEINSFGKVAGWGLTNVHTGSESLKLKVLNMPYVDIDKCLQNTPPYYHEFFSGDKFCGGFVNGTSLCKGDSGGGYTVPYEMNGRIRYYLRGIVSTSPPLREGFSCNIYTYTSFTDVMQHKILIMKHLV